MIRYLLVFFSSNGFGVAVCELVSEFTLAYGTRLPSSNFH